MISLREDEPGVGAALAEEVEAIFSESGLLSKVANFEYRPQQQEMAVRVAEALEAGRGAVVEAGTGVGKSLAYLIPAVLFAVREKRKAIISTHTINLQEQLVFKDIPLVQKVLPVEFQATLLKGRQNYCCGTRLDRALLQGTGLFTTEEQKELERIREWSLTTKEGSLSDFIEAPDPAVWAQVCSERHLCTPKSCARNPRCFYQAVRRRIAGSDVLVVNHTLFFTLLGEIGEAGERERGFLYPGDFVVFDEAHTLEATASRHIGLGVSQFGVRQALQRLYNPRTNKGLLQFIKDPQGVGAVAEIIPEWDAFFREVGAHCNFNRGGREFRVREPGLVDASEICDRLKRLSERVKIICSRCDNEALKSEMQEMCRRLAEARAGLLDFLRQELPGHVYWVEKTGRREQLHALNAAPIDLAAVLRRLLFREGNSCILTSATLSVGSPSLDYFRNRVGAEEVAAFQIGSPFDYEKQMTLHLVRKMPDPRQAAYPEALAEWIKHFTDLSGARAFVLFTSYKTMQTVAALVEPFCNKKGWDLLVQGQGMPRNRMIEEFRASRGAVLFGTESFWSGVDVAGDALSNVIITRLPFATPDHPVVEAKLEAIEAAGGDAFQSFSLPEAILKLRQGAGRLIRSKTDSGMVVILDSRILSKSYGRAFLRALPKCKVEIL